MLRGLFLFFKVGIILHYSTLATVLWLGVTSRNIYKQVTKKAKRCQDTDEPPPPPRPMLRWAYCLLVQRCLPDHHAHILTRNYKGQYCFFSSAIQVASRFFCFQEMLVRMRWRVLGLVMLLFQHHFLGFDYSFRLEHFPLNCHRGIIVKNCVIGKLTNSSI